MVSIIPGEPDLLLAISTTASESITDFISKAIPNIRTIIFMGPATMFCIGIIVLFVSWLKIKKNLSTQYTRKIFHFIIFTFACIFHILFNLSVVVLFGCLVSSYIIYAVYRGEGFPFYEAIARPTDEPHRRLFVVVPLFMTALGGIVSSFLFGKMATVGYLVNGWGDAAGEPVGIKWGNHNYKVPSLEGVPARRSLEGSVAVAVVGMLAAYLGVFSLGFAPLTAFWAGIVGGSVGAIVEAFSHHGLDNLTIQIFVSGVVYLLLA